MIIRQQDLVIQFLASLLHRKFFRKIKKLHGLETATNKIEHFIRNYNFPSSSVNAINVESYDSDYEIKVWFDASNNTAYYYTNPETIILDSNCQGMFMRFDKMK